VPSRNRTIRPSAPCLRCIRKISPLWRFSNLRKLSTIHPTCGLCAPKTRPYESYHWARQMAANCSQKRCGGYCPGLVAIRKLASLVQIVVRTDQARVDPSSAILQLSPKRLLWKNAVNAPYQVHFERSPFRNTTRHTVRTTDVQAEIRTRLYRKPHASPYSSKAIRTNWLRVRTPVFTKSCWSADFTEASEIFS
jgi:hypothetical protein